MGEADVLAHHRVTDYGGCHVERFLIESVSTRIEHIPVESRSEVGGVVGLQIVPRSRNPRRPVVDDGASSCAS